jgi:hypothetical protein
MPAGQADIHGGASAPSTTGDAIFSPMARRLPHLFIESCAKALSVYFLGGPIGVGCGLLVSGLLGIEPVEELFELLGDELAKAIGIRISEGLAVTPRRSSPRCIPPSGKSVPPVDPDQMGVPAPYGIPAQPCAGWSRGQGIRAPTPSTEGRISQSAHTLAEIRLPFGIPVSMSAASTRKRP